MSHQRSVLFVKPGYWIVMDTLTADSSATSDGLHEMTRFFHLPPDADAQFGAKSASTGYLPGPRRTALDAPVVALVNKVALPATLCALLVLVSDPAALPTITRVPMAEGSQQAHLRIALAGRTKSPFPMPRKCPKLGKMQHLAVPCGSGEVHSPAL